MAFIQRRNTRLRMSAFSFLLSTLFEEDSNMDCSVKEFMQYIEEEDIKFIRLTFCDIYGTPKNISVMANDIGRVLENGLAIHASFIKGFRDYSSQDLVLHPDPATTSLLPWRPEHGKVIRMFCDISLTDGTPFRGDTRYILKQAVSKAEAQGITYRFGSRMEFYLFKTDEDGNPSYVPYDNAGYMDVAPLDKGENVRREICLTLERMGITPVNSHHEAGPGQNEIDYASSDPLTAADHASTFMMVVKTIAARNGLYADFSPKPLTDKPGSGFHINLRADSNSGDQVMPFAIAGILKNIYESTVFFNPTEDSYLRLGEDSAPRYITWSKDNLGQLIRIPPAPGTNSYAQLRSPNAGINPYLAFAILIEASLEGIKDRIDLEKPTNKVLTDLDTDEAALYKTLPQSLAEARKAASGSSFLKSFLDETLINSYCNR